MVVLRGRPLTRVRANRCKTKIHLSRFSFLFSSRKSQREYIRVRKLGYLKTDTYSQRRERRLQENGIAWGVESCVTSLAQVFASSCILTCFSCAARGVLAISTSVRVRPIFFFFFLVAIVLATYQVVFADFVFNQFLSDFKNKHTAARVL